MLNALSLLNEQMLFNNVKGDGEDLGGHQVHGKRPPDVEGTRCCPTCQLGVKGMSE